MPRYQIEWLPDDAIAPLDEDPVLEMSSETQEVVMEDWTGALSTVLDELGCGPDDLKDVVCELAPTGKWSVAATDGRRATIRPLPDDGLPPVRMPEFEVEVDVESAPPSTEWADVGQDGLEPEPHSLLGRILGPRPTGSYLNPPDLPTDPANATLDGLLAVIPAESAAVLRHDRDRNELKFIAARGPRAHAVLGRRIPENAGVAGLVRTAQTVLCIQEADDDPTHDSSVDRAVGYRTRALLAVPVIRDGETIAIVELLNPRGGTFEAWHRQLVAEAAARLADRL